MTVWDQDKNTLKGFSHELIFSGLFIKEVADKADQSNSVIKNSSSLNEWSWRSVVDVNVAS